MAGSVSVYEPVLTIIPMESIVLNTQRLFFYWIVYGQVSSDLNTATSESLSFQIWVILNLLIPQILTKDLLCEAPSHTPQRQGWIRVSLYGQAEMLCDSSLPRPV